jgi:VanZ family protein
MRTPFLSLLTRLSRYHLLSSISAVIILVVCVIRIPSNESLSSIPYIDKIVHFLLFFTFGSLYILENWLISSRKRYKPWGTFLNILLLIAVFGGLIELIQQDMTTYRSAELKDWLFDMTGAVTSLLVSWIYYLRHFRGKNPSMRQS